MGRGGGPEHIPSIRSWGVEGQLSHYPSLAEILHQNEGSALDLEGPLWREWGSVPGWYTLWKGSPDSVGPHETWLFPGSPTRPQSQSQAPVETLPHHTKLLNWYMVGSRVQEMTRAVASSALRNTSFAGFAACPLPPWPHLGPEGSAGSDVGCSKVHLRFGDGVFPHNALHTPCKVGLG